MPLIKAPNCEHRVFAGTEVTILFEKEIRKAFSEKLVVYKKKKAMNKIRKVIIVAVLVILAVITALLSIRTIDAEYVGIRVTFGKVSDQPCYGLSVKLPVGAHFVKLDKTTQRFETTDATYTKDIQSANLQYVFTYKIVDANAPKLYLSAGRGYEEKLVQPVLRSVIKDVVGRWTAQELVSNRDKAANEIQDVLLTELNKEFFTEISFQMANIDYSDNFEKGIEAKVLAEQEAQRAKNLTVKIEEEARQDVIRAEAAAKVKIEEAKGKADAEKIEANGKAAAIRTVGAAIRQNPEYLEQQQLEVQREVAKSASGWKTVVIGETGTLLNLPVTTTEK